MKVKDILHYNKIIRNIIDSGEDINALTKFKMLGMLKQFEPIIENFSIIRDDKIRQYGTPTENGGYMISPPKKESFENDADYNKAIDEFEDTIKKFNADIEEVANAEVETKIKKFGIEIMDTGIPADYLLALYDLIEVE